MWTSRSTRRMRWLRRRTCGPCGQSTTRQYPAIKLVYVLLRMLLQQHGLAETREGGLPSYALFSMVHYVAMQAPAAGGSAAEICAQHLLLALFDMFDARAFDPQRFGI